MLNFQLDPETEAWRKKIRDFACARVLPREDLDTHGHFPIDLYQEAFEAGIITCMLPKEYGGGGRDFFEGMLAIEECAYADLGFTTSAFLLRLALAPLLLFGSEEQKKKWIPPFTQSLRFASFGFTEPEGSTNLGSRPASTIATQVEGGFLVNGTKSTISNAQVAFLYTVFARMDGELSGTSCFVIPRESKGVSTTVPYRKMGQRAANTADVIFKDVFIPTDHLIGKPGQGAQISLYSLRHSRIGVGAMAIGVSERARDLAKEHCHARKTGEGKPIIFEQDIKFKFATLEAKIEMLRAFVYRAAWELEHGKQGTKFSSAVKLMGGEIASEITNACLELHGGKGYLEEGKIEKLVRDSKILQIYEGTDAVQKILIADTAIRLQRRSE